MRNTTVNVGPLLVTMSVVFTAYFTAVLALPAMPVAVHEVLAAVPPVSAHIPMKGLSNEARCRDACVAITHGLRLG